MHTWMYEKASDVGCLQEGQFLPAVFVCFGETEIQATLWAGPGAKDSVLKTWPRRPG